MTRLSRLFFCFLCFFLDVHVRASEVAHVDGHADHGCAEFPCTLSAKKQYVLKSPSLVIEAGGLAEQRSRDTVRLVRGTFLLQEGARFTTAYGAFDCEGECVALVERKEDRVVFKNIRGDWQVTRLGDKQVYAVPAAMQVVVRAVTADGQAELEFPQSLPWLPLVKSWGRLFQGSKEDFTAQMSEFREVWEAAVAAASELHAQAARREIASRDKALAIIQARRQAEEREDAKLRRQFREKNGL